MIASRTEAEEIRNVAWNRRLRRLLEERWGEFFALGYVTVESLSPLNYIITTFQTDDPPSV